jgi:spermidine/putrescine transport system substrate-binding protein
MTDRDELIRLTLQQLDARRASRRRFVGHAGLMAGGVLLGPTFLAACGSSDSDTSGGPATTAEQSGSSLRISNWPLYIDEDTVPNFQDASGLSVTYTEDVNDNEEYFAKIQEPLSRGEDVGADLFVITDFLVARLITLGWLAEIDDANVPNKANLVENLSNVEYDPDRTYSLPWFSGMSGLAYNKAAVGREITSLDDLFDPEFKGKVSMFSDLRDGLGQVMLWQGNSPEDPTEEAVQQAADAVQEQVDNGQIRRFTGNDYGQDLSSGDLVIAQAYSGDVAQLQLDNPDLAFVVPESGGIQFSDNMVMPTTTRNKAGAEEWMNFIYDRVNYAPLTAFVQYFPVVSDITKELEEIDPTVAENPLINPPQSTLDNLVIWATLTDEQDVAYAAIYSAVTSG